MSHEMRSGSPALSEAQRAPPRSGVFSYRYRGVTCTATIDGATLVVKQGLRTFRVPLATMRAMHVDHHRPVTLVVATEPAPGKKKILRFSAVAGQPSFDAFAAALAVHMPPGGDLRAKPTPDALKAMGARDVQIVTVVLFASVLTIGAFVTLLPKLIHGLDFGRYEVPVGKVARGPLESRNVVVTEARAWIAATLAVTTTQTKYGMETGRWTESYVPLMPSGFQKSDAVHAVLHVKKLTEAGADELVSTQKFPGIARTVLWEGLDGETRAWFKEKIGVKIADDCVLVDYEARHSTDLLTALGADFATAVLMGGLAWVTIWARRRKR